MRNAIDIYSPIKYNFGRGDSMADTLAIPDKIKAESVKGEYEVYKPHPILLAKDTMTLWQQRFFAVYLSKIVPGRPETYNVRFSFAAFKELLDVDVSHSARLEAAVESIQDCKFDLKKYYKTYVPEKYNARVRSDKANLFYRTQIVEDEDGKYVEFFATPIMLELLNGEYDRRFVHYEVKNYLALPTITAMRMYDCLKQYCSMNNVFKLSIETLKSYLGMEPDSYPETKIFRRDVIKKSIDIINKTEKLDIEVVSFKPYKKNGLTAGWSFSVKKKEKPQEIKTSIEATPDSNLEPEQEITEFENAVFAVVPENVHEGKIENIRAIIDTARTYVPQPHFIEFLDVDSHDDSATRLQKVSEATNQAAEAHNDLVLNSIRRFNLYVWDIKKSNVKWTAYGYYIVALTDWLRGGGN